MPKHLSDANPGADDHDVEVIPEELALEIRKLAHDLSNALEIIVPADYGGAEGAGEPVAGDAGLRRDQGAGH